MLVGSLVGDQPAVPTLQFAFAAVESPGDKISDPIQYRYLAPEDTQALKHMERVPFNYFSQLKYTKLSIFSLLMVKSCRKQIQVGTWFENSDSYIERIFR